MEQYHAFRTRVEHCPDNSGCCIFKPLCCAHIISLKPFFSCSLFHLFLFYYNPHVTCYCNPNPGIAMLEASHGQNLHFCAHGLIDRAPFRNFGSKLPNLSRRNPSTTNQILPNRTATMGRELQKKKRRSNRQPVKQSNKTKKILNPRGNNIIAKNWYRLSPPPPQSTARLPNRFGSSC